MLRRILMSTASAAVLVVAASILILNGQVAEASGPRWGADYFPNVPLVTQNGKTVHFYDDLLKGKAVAIELIYTHCVDSCPLETARLAQAQKMLGDRVGKDIFFYSITIDPKRDTPAVLKAYAEKYHVGPGWLFLTGKQADIDLISKKLGLYSDPDSGNRDGHNTQLLVGNVATGQWMQNPATENPRFLANTLQTYMDGWAHHSTLAAPSYAAAPTLKMKSPGQYLFASRCAACHTIGHGVRIGPDLLGVTNVRDHAWLAKFIQKPNEVLAAKDPIAKYLFKKYKGVQMPNTRLGPDDVQKILDFLAQETRELQKPPKASAASAQVQGAQRQARDN